MSIISLFLQLNITNIILTNGSYPEHIKKLLQTNMRDDHSGENGQETWIEIQKWDVQIVSKQKKKIVKLISNLGNAH